MKKINIDFQIYDSQDPKVFIVLDTSEWAHIENKPAIIEIILPGESKPITHYYAKNAVNILNPVNLNLDCGECFQSEMELPDGIYEVTVKGSPDKFEKNRKYLRTTKTQLDLDNLYIQLSLECFNDDNDIKSKIEKLNEIQFLLKSAEANVRYGNNCTAQDLLFTAQKLISKHKKCSDCV